MRDLSLLSGGEGNKAMGALKCLHATENSLGNQEQA